MIFENGRHTQHIFYLNYVILDIVTFFKFRGIYLYTNGHMHRTRYTCINNSRRLETYSLYKHEFELETYLENISINKFRVYIIIP